MFFQHLYTLNICQLKMFFQHLYALIQLNVLKTFHEILLNKMYSEQSSASKNKKQMHLMDWNTNKSDFDLH